MAGTDGFELGYRPALDGLRAYAVLLVVGTHAGVGGFEFGYLGVDVFFTLSGFLITVLLLEELKHSGRLTLGAFWLRRIARLAPAVIVLAALVLATDWAFGYAGGVGSGLVPMLTYTMNWYRAGGSHGGAFGHTWSLAIEEQFYLLWPIVLIVLVRLDRTLRVVQYATASVAIASAAARLVAAQQVEFFSWYFDTELRLDGIALGCFLAVAVHRGVLLTSLVVERDRVMLLGGLILAAPIVIAGRVSLPGVWLAALHLLVPLGTMAVIVGVCFADRASLLGHSTLVWIGRRSYAIYLWHWPLLRNELIGGNVAVAVTATLIAAELSYRWVEMPVREMVRRWSARRSGERDAVGVGDVGLHRSTVL